MLPTIKHINDETLKELSQDDYLFKEIYTL